MHSTGSGRRTSGPCGTAAHEALADTEPFLELHSFEFSKVRVSMVERSASGGWWESFSGWYPRRPLDLTLVGGVETGIVRW